MMIKKTWSAPKVIPLGDHSSVEGAKLNRAAESAVRSHCGLGVTPNSMCEVTTGLTVSTARIHYGGNNAGRPRSGTFHFMATVGTGVMNRFVASTDVLPYGPS